MADYIDREELLKLTENITFTLSDNATSLKAAAEEAVQRVIQHFHYIVLYAPSIDAVEVVRCKDCKHCEERQTANGNKFDYCKKVKSSVLEHFYCIWGEKE